MLTTSYWLWDKVLSKDFCNLVLKETDWNKKEIGTVGSTLNGQEAVLKQRITDVVWANAMSPIGCVAWSYITSANKQANWDYEFIHISDVQIGRYQKKGHYDWHIDTMPPDSNGFQRKLSISIQLNDCSEYEGGKLEFRSLPDAEQPKMQQGSVIVFPSFLEHRVTPVVSGTRYSAVTWAGGPAFR